MPNFKKDTSKFQMKNMAYWKAKFDASESNSPFNHPHPEHPHRKRDLDKASPIPPDMTPIEWKKDPAFKHSEAEHKAEHDAEKKDEVFPGSYLVPPDHPNYRRGMEGTLKKGGKK